MPKPRVMTKAVDRELKMKTRRTLVLDVKPTPEAPNAGKDTPHAEAYAARR